MNLKIFILLLILPICFAIEEVSDFDNDGIPDKWEQLNGLRFDVVDNKDDPDNDGLTNLEEFKLGTDPNSIDSDGDSLNDYYDEDPLKKERLIWPLIIIPILIILAVFVLFLFEKYHLDIWIKNKWDEFNTKKKPAKQKPARKPAVQQKPKIVFKNLSEIHRQRELKKFQRREVLKKLGTITPKQPVKEDYVKKAKRNKANKVPTQLKGLMSTIEDYEKPKPKVSKNKEVFEKLKKIKK